MSNHAEDPNTDSSNGNGNDGFVWSQRLTVIAGFVIAKWYILFRSTLSAGVAIGLTLRGERR